MNNTKKAYILNTVVVFLLFMILQFALSGGMIGRRWQSVLILICINVILAVSLNLTTGVLGQIALGHAGFMSIGAYASALITKSVMVDFAAGTQVPIPLYIVALFAGGLAAALIGLIVGLPALRLRGDYLAIVTLGFAEIIRVIIEYLDFTGGAQGLRGISKMTNIPIIMAITIVVIFLMFTLGRSRQGRAIISIREDEIAAESSGINTIYYKTMAFVVSAFFAGIAGGIYAHSMGLLTAKTFGFMKSVEILIFVVLGGMGSFTGSIVAAVLLTVLPELLRSFADYRMLLYSIMLVLVMIFKPSGLLGRYEFSLVNTPKDIKHWLNERAQKKQAKKGEVKDGNDPESQ